MADNHNNPAETHSPSPGILIADHFWEKGDYHVVRPRGTRDWLIIFTLNGRGVYRNRRGEVLCEPGGVLIIPPGVSHDYGTDPNQDPPAQWEFVWSHFVPHPDWNRWLSALPEQIGIMRLDQILPNVHRRLKAAFQRLIEDCRDWEKPNREDLALNAMQEIVILLHQAQAQPRSVIDPRIEEVMHRLTQRMSEPHTVASLAASVGLSPSRLAHLFKEQTGDSIIETLIKIRLRHAAKLLEFTGRTISEIAEEVGFQSPFYFTKQFKVFYGMSPTRYRKEKETG